MGLTFADIRTRVARTIEEGAALPASSPFTVSQLWRECLVFLDYIRELSDAQLQYIRMHTTVFSSTSWVTWAHDPARIAPSDDARKDTQLIKDYLSLVQDLPERFWGDEPIANEAMRLLGLPFGGRLITDDVVRYQRAITNLHDAGLLGRTGEERIVCLEIGAGYGGIAHQIGRMVPRSTYIILDLPEMLFWPAVFLRLNNPPESIYLYDPETFAEAGLERIVASYKFVILPHYVIERLASFPTVNVAINIISMQEMREAQVRAYCAFLSRHLEGWFYSDNFARHEYNRELTCDLYDIFVDYFHTLPATKLSEHPQMNHYPWKAYVYLLTPKARPAAYEPIRRTLRGRDYVFGGPAVV